MNFLPCTLQILLSWMMCWLIRAIGQTNRYICINQDVPTYFHAVQRSRLPIVAMLLDRGLSDTNVGEANHKYFTRKNLFNWRFFAYPFSSTRFESLLVGGGTSYRPQTHPTLPYGSDVGQL